MKKQSPIYINNIRFYVCDYDKSNELNSIFLLPYDSRHDFCVNGHSAGIAVSTQFCNERQDKGVRRKVSYTLIDMTDRYEVAKKFVNVVIAKDYFLDVCISFPAEVSELAAGHTFKIVVCDENSTQTLAEGTIHLFDSTTPSSPDEWYEVIDGGIRPEWENRLYKMLNTVEAHEYRLQFNISPKFDDKRPDIMPELEVRLYYPNERFVKDYFVEPVCNNQENYDDNRWTVECPFMTFNDVDGVFYAELLCMEYPIAGIVFDTLSKQDVIGKWHGPEIQPLEEYSLDLATQKIDKYYPFRRKTETIKDDNSFDDAIDSFMASKNEEDCINEENSKKVNDNGDRPDAFLSLNHLTGLRSVKEKLAIYERVVRFNKMRADKGLPVSSTPLHAVFLGSPGTGKTTVAKMMGAMLHRAGVLSKGHVVIRERATLLGQNYNSEAEKTMAAIDAAQGGILFIDEAYQLYQPEDPRDPGKFVIETLLTTLADEKHRDWMLILAGYSDEMKQMFNMNPGFKSRIPDSNIYTFDDFTENELMEIAQNYLKSNNYTITSDAFEALAMRLKADYAQRDKTFGNARHVINLIQTEILPAMAVRVINEGLDDDVSLTEVRIADIPPCIFKSTTSPHTIGFMP